MDSATKTFPEFNFPKLESKQYRKRELFNDYGCCTAINTCHDGKSIEISSRRIRTGQHWDHLAATKPTLPILRHNDYDNTSPEPCMSDIVRRQEILKKDCSTLPVMKGKIMSQRKLSLTCKFLKQICMNHNYVDDDISLLDENEYLTDAEDSSEEESDHSNPDLPNTKTEPAHYSMRTTLFRLKDLTPMNFRKYLQKSGGMFEDDHYDLSINMNYSGGCLSCQSLSDSSSAVFLPRGKHMDKLCLLPAQIQNHELRLDESNAEYKSHNNPIYQVDSICSQEQVFVATRTEDECRLYETCLQNPCNAALEGNGTRSEEPSLQTRLLDTCIFSKYTPTYLSLSPYIPGELAISCQEGGLGLVKLWSPDVQSDVVLRHLEGRFHTHNNWIHTYYGSHPRQLIVVDGTGVALYDVRGSNKCGTELFNLTRSSPLQDERVLRGMRHPTQIFHHLIATDFSIVLVDERFPNHQVIQWNHALLSYPQYLCVVPDVHISSGEQLLLVSSQAIPETHAYPLCMSVSQPQPPYGAGTSWRVSRTDDFSHLVPRNNAIMSRDMAEKHLAGPLVGMCGVCHRSDEGGVSVLQLSSTGNLFNQDYQFMPEFVREKTQSGGPGYTESPCLTGDKLSDVTDWLQDYKNYLNTETPVYSTSDQSWVLEESHIDQVVPHIHCAACSTAHKEGSSLSSPQASSVPIQEFSMCYNCHTLITLSRKLKDSAYRNTIPPDGRESTGELAEHFSELTLSNPQEYGYTSQIILKLWHGEDVMNLSRQRDDYVKKRRAKRFEKWKAKKTQRRPSSSEEESLDEMSTDSKNVISDNESAGQMPNSDDANTSRDTTDDCEVEPAHKLPFTSPRQRYSSTSSRSSILSTSSRISVPGFAVTPPRLKQLSPQSSRDRHSSMPAYTLPSSLPHSRHASSSSSTSSTLYRTYTPHIEETPQHGQDQSTFTFTSPSFLSPQLLSQKSSSLVTGVKLPAKKKIKRSQVPGF